jgi:hypothetical protein
LNRTIAIFLLLLEFAAAAQNPGSGDRDLLEFFEPYLGNPAARDPNGPYYHRILLATSSDGIHWKAQKKALLDHASVPEIFEGPDGRAIILYVDGASDRLRALVEESGGWRMTDVDLEGVDPNVIRLADGGYRAFVKAGKRGAMDAYKSADGLHWERIGTVFQDSRYPTATDPDVFVTPDGWVMLLSLGPKLLRCTSSDGSKFRAQEVMDLGGSVCDTIAIRGGGGRTFFHVNGNPQTGDKMQIRSAVTTDGKTWKVERGSRLEAPGSGPAALGAADPAVLQRSDGTWVMVFKSFIPKDKNTPGSPSPGR